MYNQLIEDGESSRPHCNVTLQCPFFNVARMHSMLVKDLSA